MSALSPESMVAEPGTSIPRPAVIAEAEAEIFDTIYLGDKSNPLRVKLAKVPTMNVYLDPENPRLVLAKQINPNSSLEQLVFLNDDTKWLKADIFENCLVERPYVRLNADGTYTSVEGNRRTACYRAICAENKDDPFWTMMPVWLLPPNINKKQELTLMAGYHVAGRVKWDAHERAGHVYRMMQAQIPMDTLKTILHLGEPAIKRMIWAYDVMFGHFAKLDKGKYAAQAEGKYSYFAELVANRDWVKKIDPKSPDRDVVFIDQFCEWVGSGRIPTANDVRVLPEILNNRQTRTAFENGEPGVAFSNARAILDHRNPSRKSKFFKVLKTMVETGKHADLADIDLAGSNDIAKQLLTEARQVIDRLQHEANKLP